MRFIRLFFLSGILVAVVYVLAIGIIHTRRNGKEVEVKGLIYYSKYCAWNDRIDASEVGWYEMRLCYRIASNPPIAPTSAPTIEEWKIRINGSRKSLRFKDLANIPDAEWLNDFD
ncbi:unnamed protein product, partial [Hydatigera taeniaeformis]|uniref:DUF3592 domain-containing protein n=1 Tax=Hydatigena taeniaeformis TaxID=6205 RepID=A0A0R3WUK5_HYDTA